MSILDVCRLTKTFGGFRAVSNLSFTVEAGTIVGLVGPNGAGKTTTFNIISGFVRPTSGRIAFNGEDVTGRPPHALARRGIVRTFQNTRVFSRLTVEENIAIGCYRVADGRGSRPGRVPAAGGAGPEGRVREILERIGLAGQRSRTADELPYGDQRVLGIGIALAAGPALLLLDEPFAGMNPAEADRCMALIHTIRQDGMTVLLIDHHMGTLMKHCDHLVVMHHGEKLAEGTPAVVRADPQVVETYLGSDSLA